MKRYNKTSNPCIPEESDKDYITKPYYILQQGLSPSLEVAGWTKRVDGVSGETYYYNTDPNETQWYSPYGEFCFINDKMINNSKIVVDDRGSGAFIRGKYVTV